MWTRDPGEPHQAKLGEAEQGLVIQDPESRIRDPGVGRVISIQDPRSGIQEGSGGGLLAQSTVESGDWILDLGFWILPNMARSFANLPSREVMRLPHSVPQRAQRRKYEVGGAS